MGLIRIDKIDKAEIKNKRILCRFDFNVPIDTATQKITDTTRIDASLPTIKYLLEQGAAKIIMMGHLGRPKGKVDSQYSLEPVASYLAEQLKLDVVLTETCIDEGIPTLINLPTSKLILLENLRFHPEEEKNDKIFAEKLARYGDIYVNDGFGVSHRKHASVHQIVASFPHKAFAGLLLSTEVEMLEKLLHNPAKPFAAIIGGAKVSDKIKTIERLLVSVDQLFIGGAMAYPFLKIQGIEIGTSLCAAADLELAQQILRADRGKKIYLPLDHITAHSIQDSHSQTTPSVAIDEDQMGLDIGPQTVEAFKKILTNAKTIFWNGPMGLFENPLYAHGTMSICKILAELPDALTIIGGGDSVSAVQQSGLASKMKHISTGGGASLEFIEKGDLPGIQALKFGVSS